MRHGRHPGSRHHAVAEDLARVVDVGEERLERPHPLLDAGLDCARGEGRVELLWQAPTERELDALRQEFEEFKKQFQ